MADFMYFSLTSLLWFSLVLFDEELDFDTVAFNDEFGLNIPVVETLYLNNVKTKILQCPVAVSKDT